MSLIVNPVTPEKKKVIDCRPKTKLAPCKESPEVMRLMEELKIGSANVVFTMNVTHHRPAMPFLHPGGRSFLIPETVEFTAYDPCVRLPKTYKITHAEMAENMELIQALFNNRAMKEMLGGTGRGRKLWKQP